MKRLYENIEDIHIKGDIAQLAEIVTVMDHSLQSLSQSTEDIFALIIRYSESNKGRQYEMLVNTTVTLREELYRDSILLNEMQNDIVAYQNKVYRYEGLGNSGLRPNGHLIERANINVDTTEVQFLKSEMLYLLNSLGDYSNSVYDRLRDIVIKKEEMASIWDDTQYCDFSDFIDQLSAKTIEAVNVFDDYFVYLNDLIMELN